MKKRLILIVGLLLSLSAFILPTLAQTCGTQVTVQAGDTLWDIARECDVTVPAILEANFSIGEPSVVEVGQVIVIPTDDVARQPQVNIYPQSVSPGDRIQIIANGFPLTTDVLVGAGQEGSEFSVSQTVKTDRQGALYTSLTIPPTAALNGRWVVVVQTTAGTQYRATSFAFFIDEETVQAPIPQPTNPPSNLFTQTQIYLVALNTNGGVGCGDSVIPYTVSIEPTVAPLTAALNQLFFVGSRPFGYYNALGASALSVEGINIEDGVATINLRGTMTVGGVCDVPRIEAQLRQTALQYHTIDTVNIFINGQPLASVLSSQ